MLKTRVITALVILPIVLTALFALPGWAWAAFTLSIMATAAWEWRRFCPLSPPAVLAYYLLLTILAAGTLVLYFDAQTTDFYRWSGWVFAAAAVFWMLLVPLWLATAWRAARWPLVNAFAGGMVILPMWIALLLLRDVSPWLLLSFAAVVWMADIAAYFAGKTFGKHKLAPAISPGKTIEGVIGGLVGVALYFFVWRWLTGSWASERSWPLQDQGLGLLAFFLLLALISVVGDLLESWMKRGVGMKDSSGLLPGHGGILDRIDALTSTLPVAALYVMVVIPRT